MEPWFKTPTSSTLDPMQADEDGLLTAIHILDRALLTPPEHDGNQDLIAGLSLLNHALNQHVARADEIYREIDGTRSTLVRGIERNHQEYTKLLRRIRTELELAEKNRSQTSRIDHHLRQQVAMLLSAVRHHLAVEDNMVFESSCTDLGAGD